MNNTITEIKSTLEGTNSRITEAKDNLRDLWDNIKHPNIQIIGIPEEEDKKAMRKYLRRE